MEPFYSQGGITVYNGDSRALLQQVPDADLVIIDPPYGMNWQSGFRTVQHDKIQGDNQLPVDLINMAIAKAKNAAYVFCAGTTFPPCQNQPA